MPLQGNLNELNVLEVVQLIGTQRKSTTLRLQSDSDEVHLHFREGQMIASHRCGCAKGQPFLDAMVALTHLSPGEAIEIAGQVEEQSRDLWKAVSEVAHLTQQTCEQVYRRATDATIDRVLLWEQGRFALDPLAKIEPVFRPGLSTDSILLDAMRRLDEVASLKQDTVAPLGIPCLRGTEEFYVSSDPLRRAVLRQVDGRRSVQEIVTATRLGEYDIYSTIAEGLEGGSIQILTPTGTPSPLPPPRREILRRLPAALLLTGLLVIAAGSAWIGYQVRPDPTQWEMAAVYWEELDMRRLIELYRERQGQYPSSLSQLCEENLPFGDGNNRSWFYRLDGTAYLLHPLQGSDRVKNQGRSAARDDHL